MFCLRLFAISFLLVVTLSSTIIFAQQSDAVISEQEKSVTRDNEGDYDSDIKRMPIEDLRAELQKHRKVKGTGRENRGLMRKLRLELARRGDKKEQNELFSELNSEDLACQSKALDDVARLGDREAIMRLGEMLDDPSPGGRYTTTEPDGEIVISSQAFLPPRMVAAMKLATLVENPPVAPVGPDKKFYTEDDVLKWRKWWKTNSRKYEDE